jgi:hypothetical protein
MLRFRRAALGAAAAGLLIAAGLAAPAVAANAAQVAPAQGQGPTCVVSVAPNNFVEAGLEANHSSVAFIITVECQPTFSEQYVEIHTPQLFNACQGQLRWYNPTTTAVVATGEDFNVQLDDDGNATAIVLGGPSCAASVDLIEADLTVAPFTTAITQVRISPPTDTQPGVFAFPAAAVEDAITSSVATIFYVEFPSVYSEHQVEISDAELYDSCSGHRITWILPNSTDFTYGKSVTTTLDNNGNAFVVALAGPSCASGNTLVQAELIGPPYTTFVTQFTVLSPRVTV